MIFNVFLPNKRVYIFSDKGQYLSMAGKSSLKDKLEDDELDLSMMQLSEVPVRVRSDYITLYHKIKLCEMLRSLSGHRAPWSKSDDSESFTQPVDQVRHRLTATSGTFKDGLYR